MSLISVIVTTYNWEAALESCLRSLFAQHDLQFEIIVADDGSREETRLLINKLVLESPVSLQHCWHDDLGFRAGTIRNQAALASHGDYLIFIDGDCVVLPHFVQRHRNLRQRGYFVAGNRVLLNESFTRDVLSTALRLHEQPFLRFVQWRLQRKINRLLPFLLLPLSRWRLWRPQYWQQAMTCNLAIWKADFVAVNGFDQLFEGWGYEDSDLVIRLIHNGIFRKEGRFAVPILHLWHRQNDRSEQHSNYQRLLERLQQPDFVRAVRGLNNP
jgi:glycosyltransferase involved in cell wall biosynthesis